MIARFKTHQVFAFCAGVAFAFTCLAAPNDPELPTNAVLAAQRSPYVREHAKDPVAWLPWGSEAFERARRENKPIFLSVGYSTCHWCHVMQRESFSNQDIADILNSRFVPVLVDREERPEIDRLYLDFVESSTGGGGWPLSVWLTPDLKPILGGTYYPPEGRPGRPGFKEVLEKVSEMWGSQREELIRDSDKVLATLSEESSLASATELPMALLRHRAMAQITRAFDAKNGGFGGSPKFPSVPVLEFLIDLNKASTNPRDQDAALAMATKTLQGIVDGGIHDQIGGGFHRYAVDPSWRTPHFEKMLSDQAQMVSVLVSAWQLSGNPELKAAARDTLDYMIERLEDPSGGFCSAEDADSAIPSRPGEKGEGAFYLWTASEIAGAIGSANAPIFDYAYGIEPSGNLQKEAQVANPGENVLYRAHSSSDCARKFGMAESAVKSVIATGLAKLGAVRERRPRPELDDKILTAWNGLAISAFARASQALGDPRYLAAAVRAAACVEANLFDAASGTLSHSFRAGSRDNRGFAEDYSFLIQGLIDLYETSFDTRWLDLAARLQEKQIVLFWDPAHGGFYSNADDDPTILLRLKDHSDGSEPSANSVAVRNLSRLCEMLNRDAWRVRARDTARAFSADINQDPTSLPEMMAADGWLDGAAMQILIHGEASMGDTDRLVAEVWTRYIPHHVLMRVDRKSRSYFTSSQPVVGDLPAEGGPATAYVCVNFSCRQPTGDPATLAAMLAGKGAPKN